MWKTPRSSATDLGAFSNPRSFFLHTFALRIMTYFGSQHFRNEQDTRFLTSLNLTGTSEDSCSKSGSFLHWSLVRSTKLTVLDRHKQTCPPWISVRAGHGLISMDTIRSNNECACASATLLDKAVQTDATCCDTVH